MNRPRGLTFICKALSSCQHAFVGIHRWETGLGAQSASGASEQGLFYLRGPADFVFDDGPEDGVLSAGRGRFSPFDTINRANGQAETTPVTLGDFVVE